MLGALACVTLYWILDGLFEYLDYSENLRYLLFHEPLTLGQALLTDIPPRALFERLTFVFMCLAAGAALAILEKRVRRRDQALIKHEQRYRRLFDDAAIGIFRMSPQGQVLEANSAFSIMLGLSGKTITADASLYAQDFVVDRCFYDKITNALSRGTVLSHVETKLRKADHTEFEASVHAWPVRNGNGKLECFEGFVEDISELKFMEERVRQSQKLEAIGQLAGGIAHDFNNQLSGILGYTEMLADMVSAHPQLSKYAGNIMRSVERSSDLTKKLLAFARKSRQQMGITNLNTIIDETVALLKHTIDKKIVIRTDLEQNLPSVSGDPTNIQNCLLNLALNSRDAMPDGGKLSFITEVTQHNRTSGNEVSNVSQTAEYVSVTVTDTGTGMDESVMEHIFEPFFTTKDPDRGTGMGLAALYGTVQQHGGEVKVQSTPGKGTTFTLLFPSVRNGTLPETTKHVLKSAENLSLRVLLVDDEPTMADMCSELLQSLGCEVFSSTDPKDAAEQFEETPDSFDVAVIDMMMPNMSGAELLSRIREKSPDLPAIIMSGYSEESERRKISDKTRVSFLPKPFTRAMLSESLDSVRPRVPA